MASKPTQLPKSVADYQSYQQVLSSPENDFPSGSKWEFEHAVYLRVLHRPLEKKRFQDCLKSPVFSSKIEEARGTLRNGGVWEYFCQATEKANRERKTNYWFTLEETNQTGLFAAVLESVQDLDLPRGAAPLVAVVEPYEEKEKVDVTHSPFVKWEKPIALVSRPIPSSPTPSGPSRVARGTAGMSIWSNHRTSNLFIGAQPGLESTASSVFSYQTNTSGGIIERGGGAASSSGLDASDPLTPPAKSGGASIAMRQLRENPRQTKRSEYVSNPSPSVFEETYQTPSQSRTPQHTSESPEFQLPVPKPHYDVKGEQITNGCAIGFLRALLKQDKMCSNRWLWLYNDFKFERPNEKVDMSFTAKTDGHMASAKGDILAILEVKPREREHEPRVIYQEAAEMIAWIASDKCIRRYYVLVFWTMCVGQH